MHMMYMLGILTFIFFLSVFLMCLYRNKINFKVWNTTFIILDIAAYFCWNYAAYLNGWLEDGWMTLGNISPFMFTMIPLTLFMNDKAKKYVYSALSFLCVGMFFAMLITPNHAYLFNFNAEATFIHTSEAVCHLICALYGIFLILTKKVTADFKHWTKSIIFMYSVIAFGVILNFFFHTDNFGMDPYGNYKIYMINIFGSFSATLIAYLAGVAVVLTAGMQFTKLIDRISARQPENTAESNDCSDKPAEKQESEDIAL